MPANGAPPIGRRRVLRLIAATGAAVLGGGGGAAAAVRWSGTALGADAQMLFADGAPGAIDQAIAACRAEIARLEAEFSLYQASSAVSRLNRDGMLPRPSADMRALLLFAQRISRLSNGAFDVTVQPLWHCYARHFVANPDDRIGPPADQIATARRRTGYGRIVVDADAVRIDPGMALTLNGIAQGYITDRVGDLLRRLGWSSVLVELGEIRALDGRDADHDWQIDTPAGRLPLRDRAIAVSAPAGTRFEASGRHHHLIDPASGRPSRYYNSVTVLADRAMLADALSTALSMLAPDAASRLLRHFPGTAAYVVMPDGAVRRLST